MLLKMSDPFSTAKFKKLQEKWYAKLEKSGFEDAEDTKQEHMPLKAWHNSYFFRRYNALTFEAKRAYYDTAATWGAEYIFDSKREREIWSLHCEGLSYKEIAKKLKTYKNLVHLTIARLREACFGPHN